MSAGSPRRTRSETKTTGNCVVVSPQQVTDPTILDSVAGFINEVATYNLPHDSKDQIQWAKFEQIDHDVNSFCDSFEEEKFLCPSLLLILGYTTGIQVWAIPTNGEATEILSWRHGSVKVLKILPSPYSIGSNSPVDTFASKRPLIALSDNATPGPHYCALSFLSLKTGEQVKLIKFKNPILDVLANRRSIVITFLERIAVFDAFTLEDRLTVTTCYNSPGIYPNPVALGTRWMAYAEKKLVSNKRSSGGNEGEGVQSYTATMIHAAKSLGKGLRELGETVACSLTGNPGFKPGNAAGQQTTSSGGDDVQKGVVTVLDLENQNFADKCLQTEGVVAHFTAHSEAIVCLTFDPSGLLLLTADKRGHDFHLFRIHPHPVGPAFAAVHHLYVLHRGDTSARVQDMCFSPDSRWVTVSTLRGTTHVFPVTPYGGSVGVRTHATPHVVNRMSRFHRSAGLSAEGRSHSPVSLFEAPVNSNLPYHNPRLPPYPHPTIVQPLAQIRQPLFVQTSGTLQQRSHTSRQRLNSSSEDNVQVALKVCSCFAPARAWFDNVTQPHDPSLNKQIKTKIIESLFVMSCHGTLVQYDLDPHHLTCVPKEKVCDETPIELSVAARAQWVLQRQPHFSDVPLPLSQENLGLIAQDVPLYKSSKPNHTDDRWLSQVEIITHAGPHRRLWMGPQFTFKTYNGTNGSPLSVNETQTVDVGRSKPMNMPISTTYAVLIESGSASSCDQSPKLLEAYQHTSDATRGTGEHQLKEDLADAMLESPGVRDAGGRCVIVSMKPHTTGVAKVVNPLGTVVTLHSDDEAEAEVEEESEIRENCDEALFRPVVAPKPAATRIQPVTIVMPSFTNKQSTVDNVKQNAADNVKQKTSAKKFEVQKTIEKKGRDGSPKPITIEKKGRDGSPKPITIEKKGRDGSPKPIEPTRKENNIYNKNQDSIARITKNATNKKQFPDVNSKEHSKAEACVVDGRVQKILDKHSTPIIPTKPAYSSTTTFDLDIKLKGFLNKDKDISKTLTFPENDSFSVFQDKKSSNNKAKTLDISVAVEDDQPIIQQNLITTPDLTDDVDCFDFSISKQNDEKPKELDKKVLEYSTSTATINLFKPSYKFEELPEAIPKSEFKREQKEKVKSFKAEKYQDLEPDEVLVSSEEEEKKKKMDDSLEGKSSTRKPRKPKPKLGVKITKSKESSETSDKELEEPTVVVTLPAPKKSWSSIVSTKPLEELPPPRPILDLPEIESVEDFTLDLNKISSVSKDNFFELNTQDICPINILQPEKLYNEKKVLEKEFNLLKLEKSSDDEKQETNSSQTETTESDDSSKVNVESTAMDTEEDGMQLDPSKNSTTNTSKSSKKKSKKKKR